MPRIRHTRACGIRVGAVLEQVVEWEQRWVMWGWDGLRIVFGHKETKWVVLGHVEMKWE